MQRWGQPVSRGSLLPRGKREKSLGSMCPLYLWDGVSDGRREPRDISLLGFLLLVTNTGMDCEFLIYVIYLGGKHRMGRRPILLGKTLGF